MMTLPRCKAAHCVVTSPKRMKSNGYCDRHQPVTPTKPQADDDIPALRSSALLNLTHLLLPFSTLSSGYYTTPSFQSRTAELPISLDDPQLLTVRCAMPASKTRTLHLRIQHPHSTTTLLSTDSSFAGNTYSMPYFLLQYCFSCIFYYAQFFFIIFSSRFIT